MAMNVNLDVLELIFARLDGPNLVSTALVSRAFLAGAIPTLYARIEYAHRHAKRAQTQTSPFATVAAHDHLGVHVKQIAVHAAPSFQAATIPCPAFLHDLARALGTTPNLRSFVCTVKILPPLLPLLPGKPRLHHLRIYASLGSRQTALLQNSSGLHSLALDFPSWNVIDALPDWTASMQKTLAHLTLYMSQDIDAAVLNATLLQLPHLRGLHVISCPRITHIVVLKALSHTPNLRELSLTIFPSQDNAIPPLNFATPPLTHLSIDIRASHPGLKSLIARIISRLSPRDALAICGGWIGEIKTALEYTTPPLDPNAITPAAPGAGPGGGGGGGGGLGGFFGPNFHVWQGQVHLGPAPGGNGQGNNQANDPPLLGPATPHHGNSNPNPNPPAPPPNPTNLPNFFGFSFPLPFGNHNGNHNGNNDNDDDDDDNDDDDDDNDDNNDNGPPGGPPGPPNPDADADPNSPSLIDSFPSSLSRLHLPQITPAALKEVLDRCDAIQFLGIVVGNSFVTSASAKPGKMSPRPTGRPRGRATKDGIRAEITALADVLSHANALRELIVDTTPANFGHGGGSGSGPSGGPLGVPFEGRARFTPSSVRMLMRESPLLRRVVAEGRVWESTTPTPLSPVSCPNACDIQLSLTKARYGLGVGYNHVHGPPGFGTHGGGYGQMESKNHHWFWLADSAGGCHVSDGF